MPSKQATAPISVWRPFATERFLLGAPHYPEHVDETYWELDAARMAAAGFNVVRMGEFAWHLFEPKEGTFNFSLFDKAIDQLGRHGIDTIMCTPTATPPRWLTHRYPEVLRVDGNGRVMSHGSRQHADTASPVLRTHSQRITRAMAEHYRSHPHVIGWQTDNELNSSMSRSYSAATLSEFQKFVEVKYGSIEALNRAWGGDFWAMGYGSFEEVVLPLDFAPAPPSPGHLQDYHRFLAFATARFQHDQVEILRATNPNWFIFHNLGALDDIDFRGQFSADLDVVGFDIYPFLYDEFLRIGGHAEAQALHLDWCRGLTGNFIVPEQQAGLGSQSMFATLTPEPGEMRRMAYSSIARGADGLMFFRWRPAHFGQEIHWMGIIDHDNIPRRRYEEATQFASEVNRIADDILGTHVRMDVAIAGADFDNQIAHKAYSMSLPSPFEDAAFLHLYCYREGIACGFIHPEDDLSRVKVLYVPHWVMWDDKWTERIEAFARAGGTVVLGARTGQRDVHNHFIRDTAPGRSLSSLAGVTVEEIGVLAAVGADSLFGQNGRQHTGKRAPAEPGRRRYTIRLGNRETTAGHFYELLNPAEGTEVMATWSNRFADGRASVTSRPVGKGHVVYAGTYLTEDLVPMLFESVFAQAGVVPLLATVPEGVEVSMRECSSHRLLFVLNTRETSCSVDGLPVGRELLSKVDVDGSSFNLAPYGCAVIQITN